jgi:LCP family protein required for cell wall assembly
MKLRGVSSVKQTGHSSEQHDLENRQVAVTPAPTAPELPPDESPTPHRSPVKKWLFRGFVLGLSATVSAVVGAVLVLMTPLPSAVAPEGSRQPLSLSDLWRQGFRYQITRPVNILVMGIDLPMNLPDGKDSSDVFAGRSDTMLLVHVDPQSDAVSVLSIPRDTRVEIPDLGVEKINYANVAGGPKLSAQVVSRTLNGITIDRYVRVSTGAFRELVDLMGGIEVYVPERMQYTDNTQKLNIDLQPGQQHLNGQQAEQFARFRHDNYGDIGRVQRQQQVIRALREKVSDPAMITKLPQAIELFKKYIDTNLSMEEMLALADMGLDLNKDSFRMVMLPGRFSTPAESVASYWIMDPAAKDQIMQEYFDVSSVASVIQHHDRKDLQVAVQNASGNPQLGSQVATFLQSQGFSNVYVIDDSGEAQAQTQIIAQRGDLESAKMVETVLGLGEVVPASTGDIQSDLTIRVGSDWAQKPRI